MLGRWWPLLVVLVALVAVATWGQRYMPGFGAPIPCELSPQECEELAAHERRSRDLGLRLLVGGTVAALLCVLLAAAQRPDTAPATATATATTATTGGSPITHALVTAAISALVWAGAIPVALFLGLLNPAWIWVWLTLVMVALILLLDSVHRVRAPAWGPRTALLVAWAGIAVPALVSAVLLFLTSGRGDGMWPLTVAYLLLVMVGPALVLVRRRDGGGAGTGPPRRARG